MLQLIYFILVTQDVHFRTATKEAHVACPIHNLCPRYYELYLQKPIGQKRGFWGMGKKMIGIWRLYSPYHFIKFYYQWSRSSLAVSLPFILRIKNEAHTVV